MEPVSLDGLDARTFEERCGSLFTLNAGGGPIVLSLVKVRMLGHRCEGAFRDPFAVEFRGPSGILIPQKTYRLEQEDGNPLEIFLVQTADNPEGSLFEAVFT